MKFALLLSGAPPEGVEVSHVDGAIPHLYRPHHACTDGVVYIGHLVEDPGTGEEAEVLEAVPYRRCADSR